MDRHLLNNKGFSFVEILLVFSVILIVLGVIFAGSKGRIEAANLKRTVKDTLAISEACVEYYFVNSAFPFQVSDMQPRFLSPALTTNIFGQGWTITSNVSQVTVTTLMPSSGQGQKEHGVQVIITNVGGGFDQISVTQALPTGVSARLLYEKKWN